MKWGVIGLKGVLWGYESLAASDISYENTQLAKVSSGIKQSHIGVLELYKNTTSKSIYRTFVEVFRMTL